MYDWGQRILICKRNGISLGGGQLGRRENLSPGTLEVRA